MAKQNEARLPLNYDTSPESTSDGVIGMYSTGHLRRVLNYSKNRLKDRLEGI
jgi:hypothetical protein